MLKTTVKLKQLIEEQTQDSEYILELIDIVTIYGNEDDFEFLRESILNNIHLFIDLIKVFEKKKYVDYSFPKEYLKMTIRNEKLLEGIPAEALSLLGILKLQETVPLLWNYAVNSRDYDLSTNAVEGLHLLDCSIIKDSIENEILSYKGKGLFPEYVPSLAYKTGNNELLPFLYELGSTTSTDCYGGLIEAPAYYGEAGRPYFENIWFNSDWETWEMGTGNSSALYQATKILNISMTDIYKQLHISIESGNLEDCFEIVRDLLNAYIADWEVRYNFETVYSPNEVTKIFFPDFGSDKDLIGLVRNKIEDEYRQESLINEFYEIERNLETINKDLIRRKIITFELNS